MSDSTKEKRLRHDLRNMIASIRGYAELGLQTRSVEDMQRYFSRIMSRADQVEQRLVEEGERASSGEAGTTDDTDPAGGASHYHEDAEGRESRHPSEPHEYRRQDESCHGPRSIHDPGEDGCHGAGRSHEEGNEPGGHAGQPCIA